MCVRVTNTGKIIEDNVYKTYRCPIKWYKCIPTLLQENEITDQQVIEMKVGKWIVLSGEDVETIANWIIFINFVESL